MAHGRDGALRRPTLTVGLLLMKNKQLVPMVLQVSGRVLCLLFKDSKSEFYWRFIYYYYYY